MAQGTSRFTELIITETFEKDYKRLAEEIRSEVDDRLRLLLSNPGAKKLRFEKLTGYKNPNINTIHATRNHSHKISFEIEGSKIRLRRVRTHKKIDRSP